MLSSAPLCLRFEDAPGVEQLSRPSLIDPTVWFWRHEREARVAESRAVRGSVRHL